MTRQYCHIGSRTIAYLDSAPGETALRPYVLLHAFPIGANLWEPQIHSIPAGWRLITPDLRGFGGSTELDSVAALSIADYAADVTDLLEELGIKRAVIGGSSMGGYVALALYQSTPELFEGLVLANTRAGGWCTTSMRTPKMAVVGRENAQVSIRRSAQPPERIPRLKKIPPPSRSSPVDLQRSADVSSDSQPPFGIGAIVGDTGG
jgi:pimeloyl-ACP methyl ester carboxylesterase